MFPLDNKLCKQKIKYGRNRHDVTHWLVKSHSEVFQSCFLKLTVTVDLNRRPEEATHFLLTRE